MIKVGCCGFSCGFSKYIKEFEVVEVQRTFYDLPRKNTVEKWRESAPEDFEFTLKCWQVITHPCSSPTWRKIKRELANKENYGFFKPTKENFEAWENFADIAKMLKTKIVVFQCHPKFEASKENIENMKNFFNSIERKSMIFAFEPRNKSWTDKIVREICQELELTHCVDIFARDPAYIKNVAYIRLHGKPPGSAMYKYKYKEKDLEWLKDKINDVGKNVKDVYVMFNNIYMRDDALAFKYLLSQQP